MSDKEEQKEIMTNEEIGREIAREMFNSRIPLDDRYVIVAKRARQLMQAGSAPETDTASCLDKFTAAETSLERLRQYLESRLRDLEHGMSVSDHHFSCEEIAERVSFEIIPAQPLRVVRK